MSNFNVLLILADNPFDLLGNDVEDVNEVNSVPREIVKKNTSSKKADVPPPSANKDKARKNRPQPTGNDAAFKDKNAGRSANKSRSVDESKAKGAKSNNKSKFDRHSRSGKTDSDKKVKQAGWTADAEGELEAEVEGAEDAQDELKEEKVAKKSLEDYFKELEASNTSSQREARKVEAVDEAAVIVKVEEEFIPQTKSKKEKSKTLKTKQYLDFSATFADEAPAQHESSFRGGRGGRGSSRGNARGSRGGKNNAARTPRAPKASHATGPSLTEENFPSLA
ncbi:Stm1p CYBJADRAFT_192348 [Cyberlindnera jadinii NRRL Y-1542]|uniref:Hyaluronan/mRNA-binding protein domain-containing protein n=1 Tax=Cyberlindnera jadinii (strain ATCC 18201 / CBS 1600 / BCRC 20928 / JCM 3617 / NBRC 0987 / NRRL Y-1542) TaxID=983966 RepID=A0A1E4RUR5_CYBJN|nr:hypothetical protein CYBJADRAFT_192348 [Cyberlindnera jadinii NRRL Y-1542]ODV70951.1 hypothetical protein CYBJADRAFT_192348 [Cyberlindnera jadinii NRRL Y-1542]